MIKIAIGVEAFEAIASTLPLGSVGYENEVNERGECYVWLDPNVVNRLRAMRGPGESLLRQSGATPASARWLLVGSRHNDRGELPIRCGGKTGDRKEWIFPCWH